jgi:hypothetical protein
MTEHDRLTFAPVFVKDFDSVFGFDEHDTPFRDRTTAECAAQRTYYIAPHETEMTFLSVT